MNSSNNSNSSRTRARKRKYICISSSSSSSESDEKEESEWELEEEEYQKESEKEESKVEEEYISISSYSSSSSSSASLIGDHLDDNDNDVDEGNSEGSSDKVIRLLQAKSDLQELKLRDCRSYLQNHGLRITGTKQECVDRILMHWRLKDGNPEALYPRSSFSINCTGDVCRGDVVVFKQIVKKFIKKKSKQFPCIRTVAGTVVRESYGAGAQQHTFTIEVLWSKACKGVEQLAPLSYILVKGRKLYRMQTFRQPWKNESERHEVLAEKHERGDAARHIRAMNKALEKEFFKNNGIKRRKHTLSMPRSSKTDSKRGNRGNTNKENKKSHTHPSKALQENLKKKSKASAPESSTTRSSKPDAKRGNRGKTDKENKKSHTHPRKAFQENLKKKSKATAPESSTKRGNISYPCKKKPSTAQLYPSPRQSLHQPQMHPNIPFDPRHSVFNYDPIVQLPPFPPQNFGQAQLYPNHPHQHHNHQGINGEPYHYSHHHFHQPQTHRDNRFYPHPQFHQSETQHHHQQWNADRVSTYCVGPPARPVSQYRGLDHVNDHSNVFDLRNVNPSRL